MKNLTMIRSAAQTISLMVFVSILWYTAYPLKGLLPSGLFFKLDPLLMTMAAISERAIIPGMMFAAAMLLAALILGRFFCGWICPLGACVDLAGGIRKKTLKNSDMLRKSRFIKFFILTVVVFLAVLGYQAAWIMDPTVIAGRAVSMNVIPAVIFAVDKVFIIAVQSLGSHGGAVYDVYTNLRSSFLAEGVRCYQGSFMFFICFLFPLVTAVFVARFWCRALCPLGALYGVTAKLSLLRRHAEKCGHCGLCAAKCRMGAIFADGQKYDPAECVLCMDCVYVCKVNAVKFSFDREKQSEAGQPGGRSGITRHEFIAFLAAALMSFGFDIKGKLFGGTKKTVIRPPAALEESDFVKRCVRCGNCMKVCVTNGLQPVFFEAGPEAVWTPKLAPEIGYCQFDCNMCGKVCPSGAIPHLDVHKKQGIKLGTACVNKGVCLAWHDKVECIVCEEHCPIPEKAIKLESEVVDGVTIHKPYVDKDLCVGCGMCENKCPVRPIRAITVDSSTAERS
ncbi:MAG TPA: 4Fe-4S binding protein, partial [Candidatus Omnitrophota bacterium]|nr:4Fe-4S binding protein [Candidatus Omnitrophota bacterium]